jgi:glycosyltransferase involved in cell wall biosynthesis
MEGNKMFYFNGSVLEAKRDGIPRYAYNILLELDKIVEPNCMTVLFRKIPDDCHFFKNIKVIELGGNKHWWTLKTCLPYIIRHKGTYVDFKNALCIPGSIVCIHDIRPMVLNNNEPKASHRRFALFMFSAKLFAKKIVTVSEFTKNELCKKYHFKRDKIFVAYNAWNHMKDVQADNSILAKNEIEPFKYYYTLGSQAPHKNFKWIYEVAKRNPEKKFVIAGAIDKKLWGENIQEKLENVLFIGFVSDEENVSLMKNARMFLFPSIYEGFGIPPLEALSQGTRIAISNYTSLPEIYGMCAVYFDPYDYDVDLDKLYEKPVEEPQIVLDKYTWKNSAEIWKKVLLGGM